MNWPAKSGSLRARVLSDSYVRGSLRPADVVAAVYERIAAQGEDHVWIHLVPSDDAMERALALENGDRDLPLYGLPFAVKDNIDVAGLPTTAGCPAFSYMPGRSATVVDRLLAAGAILIGKTNMDQFATGLVGVRSPFGVARNPFDQRFIPGGSSSGSAVAVSTGLVSFSLGTDTAGSGRVPAAFNNIVGLKPTRGFFSAKGIVPACRTLDCVSVFALTCDEAALVGRAMAGYDPLDSFSRRESDSDRFEMRAPGTFRFGVPAPASREFFGNLETPALFERAIEDLVELGGTAVTVDFEPLREAACLLYQGPWVAERTAILQIFLTEHPADAHPVTRAIIESGKRYSAVETFEAIYRLADLKRRVEPMWNGIDALLTPTAGTIYSIEEVLAEPVQRNTDLGFYTNFVNLLDFSAVAVPAGFDSGGLPFGITLSGPASQDGFLLGLGDRLQRMHARKLGATEEITPARCAKRDSVALAVVGAHLRGLPLHVQLLERGARFIRTCRTASCYHLYELPGSAPRKPGLVRVADGGVAVEVEVWQIPADEFGKFVDGVPAPLTIGTVVLDSGEAVKGFLCESAALTAAKQISEYGGWRRFLADG